jgi:hypothetical protein
MLHVLSLDQNFGWFSRSDINLITDQHIFKYLPSPKIILTNSNTTWHDYDRSKIDGCVFWTSESLAFQRSAGKPIIPLSSNDFVYSSSLGPNSNHNLFFYLDQMNIVYRTHYRRLIPNREIVTNKILSNLGSGRLYRCYIFYKLLEKNFDLENVSLGYNDKFVLNLEKDFNNELVGQKEIYELLKNSLDIFEHRKLKLDWRRLRNCVNYYGIANSGALNAYIFPTKAYNNSSLIYISETIPHSKEFFITEKTIKGLISNRPCVILGCQYFLKHLHNLGFKTWENLIDESYDNEENLKVRIDKSIESANYFIKENVLKSKNKQLLIQQIAEHNRNILFNTDWTTNQALAIDTIYRHFK